MTLGEVQVSAVAAARQAIGHQRRPPIRGRTSPPSAGIGQLCSRDLVLDSGRLEQHAEGKRDR